MHLFKYAVPAYSVPSYRSHLFSRVMAGSALSLISLSASAFQFDTGNSDFSVRWDNTLKYSSAWRLKNQSSKLTSGQTALNQDDGDRNFDKGLISSRLDILSELDVGYRDFGARVSGAGWFDTEYQKDNDNDDPTRANQRLIAFDEFTDDTRHLHGGNGIAGGMAPVDVVKAISVPNTQFKEITRQVSQSSTTYQLTDDLSVGAFYQFKWEDTRLPAVGSYFSTPDNLGEGAERLIVGASFPDFLGGSPDSPAAFFHGNDKEARSFGQGGLQLRYSGETVDYGLYAIQYHDKPPQLYLKPNAAGPNFASGQVGEFYWVFPEDIRAFGVSSATSVDEFSFAGEASLRWNMPLVSSGQTVHVGEAADNDDHLLYAVGRIAHVNLNVIASFGPSFISNEASLIGEIAWNRLLSVTKNRAALDPGVTDDGVGIKRVYSPTYHQVYPGFDLSVPVGVSYFPMGKSAVASGFGSNQGGDFNIGASATYLDRVTFGLTYTHFYDPEDTTLDAANHFTFKQALKDRDFLAFSVKTTFGGACA